MQHPNNPSRKEGNGFGHGGINVVSIKGSINSINQHAKTKQHQHAEEFSRSGTFWSTEPGARRAAKHRTQRSQEQVAEVRTKDRQQHQQARSAQTEEQVAEVRAKDRQQHQQTRDAARAERASHVPQTQDEVAAASAAQALRRAHLCTGFHDKELEEGLASLRLIYHRIYFRDPSDGSQYEPPTPEERATATQAASAAIHRYTARIKEGQPKVIADFLKATR